MKVKMSGIKLAYDYANRIGAKLVFLETLQTKTAGCYNLDEKAIELQQEVLEHDRLTFLYLFFHEAGHHEAIKRGIWKIYHSNKEPEDMTENELRRYLSTALRAERWVDDYSEQLVKSIIPNARVIKRYYTASGEHFLKRNVGKYRRRLNELQKRKRHESSTVKESAHRNSDVRPHVRNVSGSSNNGQGK